MSSERPLPARACAASTPIAMLQDETLAMQARRDPEAFGILYQRHVKRVYRYHLVRAGNVEDAQDLTAQTFLAALQEIDTYRGQSPFAGWLFGIASHKAADHYRRERDHLPLASADLLAHNGSSVEETAADAWQMEQVSMALGRIAPERAQALTLRIFSGLSARQVGNVMGKSEAAVRMLVHRGLRDLRQALAVESEVGQ
ncbi:MAG: RNA polymerase sigma factor [Anaerolineae bacterium]|nr:RNA polymerase sigma factor [Anaerolineae bacterium]